MGNLKVVFWGKTRLASGMGNLKVVFWGKTRLASGMKPIHLAPVYPYENPYNPKSKLCNGSHRVRLA